jgi:CubicO group peptidase (beta-lactamase class C family)
MPTKRQHLVAAAALAVAIPLWGGGTDFHSRPPSSQDCSERLLGVWRGDLDAAGLLSVHVSITESSPGQYVASVAGANGVDGQILVSRSGELLRFQSSDYPVAFEGELSADGSAFEGFVYQGSAVVHTRLLLAEGRSAPTWETTWSLLGVPAARFPFDLYVVREDDGNIYGYFFFRDQRLPSLYGYGLECEDGSLVVGEKNLGLWFEGGFDIDAGVLDLMVTGLGGRAPMTFRRLPEHLVPESPGAPDVAPRPAADAHYVERAPQQADDGWQTATPSSEGIDPGMIRDLVDAIVSQEMTLTHSVLVVRRGKLVVEEYFYGFDRDTWHDMRSASKTVTSALIGLAIDRREIQGVRAPVLTFFPQYRHYANWDERKAQITVHDLLIMSSGLDANDSDPNSVAAEWRYQDQTAQPDWTKYALDAPMIAEPGSQILYGGANPLILGGILQAVLDEPVEWFAHRYLFGPLGVQEYRSFHDPSGVLYGGGGMYMRPRDMAKFGQLYLDGGTWRGERVMAEGWVRESLRKYGPIVNRWENEYGYLWWHSTSQVGDSAVQSSEARGAGGQYIYVVPSLELVAVITSGNYRNGRYRQPEEIMERFILPAAMQ